MEENYINISESTILFKGWAYVDFAFLMCLEWTKNVFLPKFGFKIFRIEKTAI
jgi:hypothetical protein